MKNPTKDEFLEVYKNLEDVLANNGFAWQRGGRYADYMSKLWNNI